MDQKLPEAEQIRKSFELKYYQWVPFILLSQAFFFYIPHIAWRALSRRSGIDVRDIVEAAANYKSVDKYENRQKYMTYMLTAVDQYVDDPRRRKDTRRSLFIKRLLSGICCISGKFLGNYLMVLYLFIKLAFIGNCICQLFVLNLLLGHEFHKFGFELLDKIINGKGWDTGSRIFPKISMCDFRIREIGNPKVSHRYTVQCVLPINLFNQQIFTFIWFWYGIVLIVNIYSLCVWTYRFLPSKRLRYISRRIEIMRQALLWGQKNPLNFELIPDLHFHEFERELIGTFVHDYLESDGLFILRVLSSNTSDFVCTELIQELWKYYRKQRKFNRTSDGDDDDLNDDESIEYKKSYDDDFEPPPAPLPQSAPKRAPRKATAASLNHLRPTATAVSGSRQKIVRTRKKPLDEPPPFEHKSDEQLPNADTEQDTEPGTDGFDDEANEESNDQNATTEYTNGNGNGNGGARPRPVTAAARARKQPLKNTSKPLAVISEQVASMINKSKRPGGTETVTVAIAQHLTTATLPRPKMNRTLSVDPKVLNSVTTSTNG